MALCGITLYLTAVPLAADIPWRRHWLQSCVNGSYVRPREEYTPGYVPWALAFWAGAT